MKFWVGVTDHNWFRFHKSRQDRALALGNMPMEVNFWQPNGRAPFSGLHENDLFLFKAKSPINKIVGFGHFTAFYTLPIAEAWTVFETGNGAASFPEFNSMIRPLINSDKRNERDVRIGCTVLSDCTFLNESEWIPQPGDWSPNIVTGKYYDTVTSIGKELWESLHKTTQLASVVNDYTSSDESRSFAESPNTPLPYNPSRFEYRQSKVRIGQGAFRMKVAEAYSNRCAMTGENTLPVLEAAHILPVSESGPNIVSNGLFIRSDFHKLYDIGLVSVSPDFRIKISPSIHDLYFNGKAYYRLNGEKLKVIPSVDSSKPNPEFLDWHFQNIFVA